MKRILFLLILSTILISACKKNGATAPKTTQQKLLGKWTLEKSGEQKPLGAPEVFTPSGTYTWEFTSLSKIKINGNNMEFDWVLENNGIVISGGGSTPYIIKTLDGTNLILEYDQSYSDMTGNHTMRTTYYYKK